MRAADSSGPHYLHSVASLFVMHPSAHAKKLLREYSRETHTLKALLAAAMAMAAMGAAWASVALAHKPALFHCDVEPCTITGAKDGTGKTAHFVLDIPGNSASHANETTFTPH
jgi:hypothetical protein